MFNTNDGMVLKTNENVTNAIYFHGLKLTNLSYDSNHPLLFSYNLTLPADHLSNNKIINSISVLSNGIKQWFNIEELIAKFIKNIQDDCKFNVMEAIVRNQQCYEWSIQAIKLQTIAFYNQITKSNYFIISCPVDKNELFRSWVNLQKHTLVELSVNGYEMLKEKHVCTLSMFANHYLSENYCHAAAIDELTAIAKVNYDWIKEALANWLNNDEAFKTLLNDLAINDIPIQIINELPLACAWINDAKQLWVNKEVLEDQTDLLNEVTMAFILLFKEHKLDLTDWINTLVSAQLSDHNLLSSDDDLVNKTNDQLIVSPIKFSFALPLTELKWRGYLPIKYVLNDKEYQLESFKDIYVDTCEYCLNLDSVKLFQFFNDNNLKFNTTGEDMNRSRQIPGTTYFIETNLSGKDVLMRTKKLLIFFNLDLNNAYYLVIKKSK